MVYEFIRLDLCCRETPSLSQDCGRGGAPLIHRGEPTGAARSPGAQPPPTAWLPSLAPTSSLPRPALFLILRAPWPGELLQVIARFSVFFFFLEMMGFQSNLQCSLAKDMSLHIFAA